MLQLWIELVYINQAVLGINKALPDGAVIALTQAGRMAYWNQTGGHKIIDLIGLNTEYPAKNTIDVQYIEAISPDMLMHVQIYETAEGWPKYYDTQVVLLADNKDDNFIAYSNAIKYLAVRRTTAGFMSKSTNAQLSAAEYLQKHVDDYDVFVVNLSHRTERSYVFGFKKALGLRDKMNTILDQDFDKDQAPSYHDIKGQKEALRLSKL